MLNNKDRDKNRRLRLREYENGKIGKNTLLEFQKIAILPLDKQN